ncbi:hypothetical protein AVEN_220452-1 [Araneus ventricosus]|uniref:Uncharacterized protein n=1 Tax=Araneus ventricosus TaxID=182803 RepID=A0A4Y2MH39_ARAVE|nr:hypothetical protein AVEN_220452-1 [Araneus ventricosus]
MIGCGLFCSAFWADLKTLRIIRESQASDMPTKKEKTTFFMDSKKSHKGQLFGDLPEGRGFLSYGVDSHVAEFKPHGKSLRGSRKGFA